LFISLSKVDCKVVATNRACDGIKLATSQLPVKTTAADLETTGVDAFIELYESVTYVKAIRNANNLFGG